MSARVLAAMVLAVSPGTAWACAACALRENEPGRLLMMFGMMALPFGIVGASMFALSRLLKREGSVGEETR